jgi:hypothetical protein
MLSSFAATISFSESSLFLADPDGYEVDGRIREAGIALILGSDPKTN